ncbi:Peptidyl-prolyl cis-trans isomerase CWC27 like protein [Eufriesea mexicana]|uniref:Peptidyl-prolyl cis-trans isomerase CWC27 like protein n=1 Tax=Eufriesea mexicana TaxID=516756 RepID=A0A310S9J3_9HYME|nr:Peptidyl-prolyl cis-trans isomerase CWC27 like protein [Eufriesea mexicana]
MWNWGRIASRAWDQSRQQTGSFLTIRKDDTAHLQNKHTTFGRVTGESTYSMLKLEEAQVDEIDKPHYPPRLIKSTILNNAFPDIIPRIIVQECEEVKDSSKTKTAVVKDFNLLSFGGEAKEDEEESVILHKMFSGKGKSVHDHLNDPQGMKERIKTTLRDTEKEPKKVQNYKIDDVEDDKDIKENEYRIKNSI